MTKLPAFLLAVTLGIAVHSAKAQSFTFTITSPTLNQLSDSTLDINVRYYASTFALANIIAVSENRVDTLTNAGGNEGYINFNGILNLSGLSEGDTFKLKVTCRDMMGNQKSDSVNYIFANPPLCKILLPASESYAMSSLHIKTWHQAAQATLIAKITRGAETVFSDTVFDRDIDTTILLNSSLSGSAVMNLNVRDRWGRSVSASPTYFTIDNYTNYLYMTPVYTGSGKILDYNYNKILEARNDALYIVDSGFQTASAIPGNYTVPTKGTLTKYGAVWNGKEWTNGVLYDNSYTSAAGKYATYTQYWSEFLIGWGYDIYRRDLETRTNTFVARMNENDLSKCTVYDNGTVIYFWEGNLHMLKYKNGSTTAIQETQQISGIGGEILSGDTILYTVFSTVGGSDNYLYMHDGTTKTLLSNLPVGYEIASKYIAYTIPGAASEAQVWVRDSTGNSVQRTFFGSSSSVVGLNPSGDMLFINSSKLYYLKKDSLMPREIGSYVAAPFYKDNTWYIIKANSLYKINVNAYRTIAAGNWSNPASWQYETVPLPNADVIVDTNIIVDTDVICNTIKVIPPGSITVSPGVNLTVLH